MPRLAGAEDTERLARIHRSPNAIAQCRCRPSRLPPLLAWSAQLCSRPAAIDEVFLPEALFYATNGRSFLVTAEGEIVPQVD